MSNIIAKSDGRSKIFTDKICNYENKKKLEFILCGGNFTKNKAINQVHRIEYKYRNSKICGQKRIKEIVQHNFGLLDVHILEKFGQTMKKYVF